MFVEQLPIPIITNQNKIVIDKIESLTSQINADKKENPKANTSVLETQVDELVYQLYELTPEEIAVVGGNK
jgi:type II restriction/modification system DNA methylase subunit YeeA